MSAIKSNKKFIKDQAKRQSDEKLQAQNSALKKIMQSLDSPSESIDPKSKKKKNKK